MRHCIRGQHTLARCGATLAQPCLWQQVKAHLPVGHAALRPVDAQHALVCPHALLLRKLQHAFRIRQARKPHKSVALRRNGAGERRSQSMVKRKLSSMGWQEGCRHAGWLNAFGTCLPFFSHRRVLTACQEQSVYPPGCQSRAPPAPPHTR